MKKRLQKWSLILSSAFPSATNPYWRALPLRRMKSLLAGVFFTGAVVGFAADLAQLNVQRLGRGLFWPVLFGAAAVYALVSRIKRVRPVFLIFIVVLVPYLAGGLSGLGWTGLGWLTYPISLTVSPSRWLGVPASSFTTGTGVGARRVVLGESLWTRRTREVDPRPSVRLLSVWAALCVRR